MPQSLAVAMWWLLPGMMISMMSSCQRGRSGSCRSLEWARREDWMRREGGGPFTLSYFDFWDERVLSTLLSGTSCSQDLWIVWSRDIDICTHSPNKYWVENSTKKYRDGNLFWNSGSMELKKQKSLFLCFRKLWKQTYIYTWMYSTCV